LYADKISRGKIGSRSFFTLRFSRLYPLHFVTLLLVLFLQHLLFNMTGEYLIYKHNDTYHFILNIFFMQSWGLESGESFNSPSWSVSVEVLLYILFFILCLYNLNKKYVLYITVIAGLIIGIFYPPVSRGIFSFFWGGILYYWYISLINKPNLVLHFKLFLGTAILFLVLMILESKF
jgi:peptidoglycan/LPS O-acetylase OafA/YrhL